MVASGFNYAYRRTATSGATPNSTSSVLPPLQVNNATATNTQPPTKAATPVPDKPLPPHLAQKSTSSTPTSTNGNTDNTGKASPSPAPKVNGGFDKGTKKGKKKDRTDQEGADTGGPPTPDAASSSPLSTPAIAASATDALLDGTKSPAEQSSSGARTPKTGKPPRNPWTIFMRMSPQLQVTEAEIRDFYGDAKQGITRVNMPQVFGGKPKLAYVEFGDEEAMKAGLEKQGEVNQVLWICCTTDILL